MHFKQKILQESFSYPSCLHLVSRAKRRISVKGKQGGGRRPATIFLLIHSSLHPGDRSARSFGKIRGKSHFFVTFVVRRIRNDNEIKTILISATYLGNHDSMWGSGTSDRHPTPCRGVDERISRLRLGGAEYDFSR